MAEHDEGENVPTLSLCDAVDGECWVLKVHRANMISFPKDQRALASRVWEAAMWSYRNGAQHAQQEMQRALGIRN